MNDHQRRFMNAAKPWTMLEQYQQEEIRDLRKLLGDLVTLVECDPEAIDPTKALYVAVVLAKQALELPGEESRR